MSKGKVVQKNTILCYSVCPQKLENFVIQHEIRAAKINQWSPN